MPMNEIRIPIPERGLYFVEVAGIGIPIAVSHVAAGSTLIIRGINAKGGPVRFGGVEWVEFPSAPAAPAAAVPEPPSPGAAGSSSGNA